MGCVRHLLYEVDHAGLSVSHLPVEGQGLQAVIAGQRAPGAEVHGAAGLVVAGHRFPPVGALFVLCTEISRRRAGGCEDGAVSPQEDLCALPVSFVLQASGGRAVSLGGFACDGVSAFVCSPQGSSAFACAHSVNADAYVRVPSPRAVTILKGPFKPKEISRVKLYCCSSLINYGSCMATHQ